VVRLPGAKQLQNMLSNPYGGQDGNPAVDWRTEQC
jgi:hypothetical protein